MPSRSWPRLLHKPARRDRHGVEQGEQTDSSVMKTLHMPLTACHRDAVVRQLRASAWLFIRADAWPLRAEDAGSGR
jgi:hypothetical protein